MNVKTPCQNCTGRTVGCHNNCDSYSTYKNEIERVKNIRREVWNKERAFRSVLSPYTKRRIYSSR